MDADQEDEPEYEYVIENDPSDAPECIQGGPCAVRWNRDGSGRVCTRCGVTNMVSCTKITFEDIVRTHSEVSHNSIPIRPPFDIEMALDLLLGDDVRSKMYKAVEIRTKRDYKNTRDSFDSVGVPHMRRHMEPTKAQKNCLFEYVYYEITINNFSDAVEILARFLTDMSSGPWKGKKWYPWMCALLYPDCQIQILRDEMAKYFWMKTESGQAKLKEADIRIEELRKRHEPAMDAARMVPEETYAEAFAEKPQTPKRERVVEVNDGYQRLLGVIGRRGTNVPAPPKKKKTTVLPVGDSE